MLLRLQAMTPCVMTRLSWPVPSRPPCSSASPLGSELASRSGASALGLAMLGNIPHCPVPAVPVCRAFRSTPTLRSPYIGALSWNA